MRPKNVKKSHWFQYNVLFLMEHFSGRKKYNRLGNAEKKLYKQIDEYISSRATRRR